MESPKVAGWQCCGPCPSLAPPVHCVGKRDVLKISSLLAPLSYEEVHTLHLAQPTPLQAHGSLLMPMLAHASLCAEARQADTSSNVTSSAFLPLSAPPQILGSQP